MLDLGWVELTFLAVLALVVVGPRDLPKLARGAGKLWGRVQRFYRQSLQSLQKLENEIDLAEGPDPRNRPSYYELLPDHVRRAMETAEPTRDPEQNRKIEEEYRAAMADIKNRHEPDTRPADATGQAPGESSEHQEAPHERGQ